MERFLPPETVSLDYPCGRLDVSPHVAVDIYVKWPGMTHPMAKEPSTYSQEPFTVLS